MSHRTRKLEPEGRVARGRQIVVAVLTMLVSMIAVVSVTAPASAQDATRTRAAGSARGTPRVFGARAAEKAFTEAETVVLLHGLGRSSLSMWPLEQFLEERGYRVVNFGYPSTAHPIAELAVMLGEEIETCCADSPKIHFVTHSMGGIVVRAYLAERSLESLGRVVMLSPPNQGSEIVDQVRDWELFELFFGPAARELGTDSTSVPLKLPPVDFELGIITGSRSLNPISAAWIEGPNDGTVAVDRARVQGAQDFLVVPHSHTFIMWSLDVMEQVVTFLRTGEFAGGTRRRRRQRQWQRQRRVRAGPGGEGDPLNRSPRSPSPKVPAP